MRFFPTIKKTTRNIKNNPLDTPIRLGFLLETAPEVYQVSIIRAIFLVVKLFTDRE